jgi:hypothetical protein
MLKQLCFLSVANGQCAIELQAAHGQHKQSIQRGVHRRHGSAIDTTWRAWARPEAGYGQQTAVSTRFHPCGGGTHGGIRGTDTDAGTKRITNDLSIFFSGMQAPFARECDYFRGAGWRRDVREQRVYGVNAGMAGATAIHFLGTAWEGLGLGGVGPEAAPHPRAFRDRPIMTWERFFTFHSAPVRHATQRTGPSENGVSQLHRTRYPQIGSGHAATKS